MAVKKNNLGKEIAQVGALKIRQLLVSGTVTIPGERVRKIRQTVSSKISIFKGKKMIETGFKNRETAIERAKEIDAAIMDGTFTK